MSPSLPGRYTVAVALAALAGCGGRTADRAGGPDDEAAPATGGRSSASGGTSSASGGSPGARAGGAGGEAAAAAGAGGALGIDPAFLGVNEFTYAVTLVWQGALASEPSPDWDDPSYVPVSDGATFSVRFPEGGEAVEIANSPSGSVTTGSLFSESSERLEYDFGAAMGRFVVWTTPAAGSPLTLPAELTLYGSGVPVVGSTRGELRLSP